MKKLLALVLTLAMVAGMLTVGASAEAGTIKIGMIGPLTGGAAVYGTAVARAAQIAVDEVNALGGVQFELNCQDDEHDAEKSVSAYNSLKDWGMQMLCGTVTTKPCLAVGPEANEDRIFMVTPSASAADVAYTGDNVFQICFIDPAQGKISAEVIAEKSLGSKIGIIYDSSDVYSTGIMESFVEEAEALSLEIVCSEAFTGDTKADLTTQVTKCKESGAELVFLPIYYTEASLILTQANNLGYAPKFFGCDGLDGLVAVPNFDITLAEGVMLMTPFSAAATDEKTAAFVKTYEETYGGTPNQFAADAYDAIYAIAASVEKSGVAADADVSTMCDALKTAITEITLDGLTGTGITWDANGAPTKSPLVYVIKSGVYEAA